MIATRVTPSKQQIGRLVLVVALGLLVVVKAKAGEATTAQRLACTSDAWRLCSTDIPDVSAVKACMIANKANLSPGCRATFRGVAG